MRGLETSLLKFYPMGNYKGLVFLAFTALIFFGLTSRVGAALLPPLPINTGGCTNGPVYIYDNQAAYPSVQNQGNAVYLDGQPLRNNGLRDSIERLPVFNNSTQPIYLRQLVSSPSNCPSPLSSRPTASPYVASTPLARPNSQYASTGNPYIINVITFEGQGLAASTPTPVPTALPAQSPNPQQIVIVVPAALNYQNQPTSQPQNNQNTAANLNSSACASGNYTYNGQRNAYECVVGTTGGSSTNSPTATPNTTSQYNNEPLTLPRTGPSLPSDLNLKWLASSGVLLIMSLGGVFYWKMKKGLRENWQKIEVSQGV